MKFIQSQGGDYHNAEKIQKFFIQPGQEGEYHVCGINEDGFHIQLRTYTSMSHAYEYMDHLIKSLGEECTQ